MFDSVINRQPIGLTGRLLTLVGLGSQTEQKVTAIECDRYAALDDPATRKALAALPSHLLRDIGVCVEQTQHDAAPLGDALRKYLW